VRKRLLLGQQLRDRSRSTSLTCGDICNASQTRKGSLSSSNFLFFCHSAEDVPTEFIVVRARQMLQVFMTEELVIEAKCKDRHVLNDL